MNYKELPQWFSSKEFTCTAGDKSLNPGSGRSPGVGNGLENPMDTEAWRAIVHEVTKSPTCLKHLSAQACMCSTKLAIQALGDTWCCQWGVCGMSMPAVGAGVPWCDIHLLQTEGGKQGGANLGRQKAGEQKEGYRRSIERAPNRKPQRKYHT